MGFIGEHQADARDRDANAPPGITLWRLLDVDEKCLPRECRVAVLKVPFWWVESGRPAGRVGLSVFLHNAINRCTQEGIRYPKIILKRLKQAQRNEWEPADYSTAAIMRRGGFQSAG